MFWSLFTIIIFVYFVDFHFYEGCDLAMVDGRPQTVWHFWVRNTTTIASLSVLFTVCWFFFRDPADLSDFLSSGFFSLPDNSECLTPQPQPEHQEKCQRVESGLSFWSDGAGKHDLSPILVLISFLFERIAFFYVFCFQSGQEPRLNGNSQSNEVQKANETGLEQKFSFSQSQVETSATERISSTNERIVEKPMANEAVVVSTPSALAIDPAVSSSSNVSLLPPAKSVDTKKPTKPAFRIVSVDETNNKLNSSESLKSPTNASSTGSKIPVAQVNPTPRPVSRLETTTSEVSCGQGGSAAPAKPAEPPPAAVILAPQNGLNHQTFYGKIDGPNGPILLPISIVNGQMVLTAQVQTIQTPNGMISLCIPASGQFGGSTMPPIIMAPASVAPQSQPVETPKYFAAVPAVNNTPVTSEKVPISKAKKKPTASTTKKPNRVLKAKSVVETNSSSPQSPAILPRQNSVCVANFPQQPAIAPQPFVQILSSQQRQASPAQFQTVSSFVQRSYTQAPQPRPTAAAVCQTLLGSTGDGKFTVRLSAEEQNQLNRINTQIQSLQSAISKPSNYTDLMNSLEDQRRSILRKAVFQQLG